MEKSDTKLQKSIELYISLVYSEKSDLNAIENLDERKKAACERAKLDFKSDAIQNIVQMKDLMWKGRIIDQLITQNSNEYMLLVADQNFYCECIKALMEPMAIDNDSKNSGITELDFKTKSLVSKSADELLERMKPRYLSIFKGEAESKVAQEMIRSRRLEDRLKNK